MDYEMIEELVKDFCKEQLTNAKLDSDRKNNYKNKKCYSNRRQKNINIFIS